MGGGGIRKCLRERADVDGKKLFLCLKVLVAAIGPPNIVTVLCIYCSSNSAHSPLGVSIKFLLFYFILFYFILLLGKKKTASQDQRSVVSDPALHVKTKLRPCRAKLVSGNCCRYHGNGQFVVVSSVCSGGVTRVLNWRPPTSKKRGVLFF